MVHRYTSKPIMKNLYKSDGIGQKPITSDRNGPQGIERVRILRKLIFAGDRPTEGLPDDFFISLRESYGPVTRIRVPFASDIVVVSDPHVIKRVLEGEQEWFPKNSEQLADLRNLFGEGLVTSSGSLWREQKKVTSPLLTGGALQRFRESTRRVGTAHYTQWAEQSSVELTEASFDLHLDLLGQVLLGAAYSSVKPEIVEALSLNRAEFAREASPIPTLPDWIPTQHNRRLQKVDELLEQALRDAFETYPADDDPTPLAEILLFESPLTTPQVIDQVQTLLVAGLVTGKAFAWLCYELLLNPEQFTWIKERIKNDVELDGNRRTNSIQDPLTWVIDEALRLHPPLPPAVRTSKRRCVLGGVDVPAGTHLYLNQTPVHTAEKYWEDPMTFDPKRFDVGSDTPRPRYAYYPFGGGARSCIGRQFAYQTLRTLLYHFLDGFELRNESLEPESSVYPIAPPEIVCSVD